MIALWWASCVELYPKAFAAGTLPLLGKPHTAAGGGGSRWGAAKDLTGLWPRLSEEVQQLLYSFKAKQ